jgi:hypothetical protein
MLSPLVGAGILHSDWLILLFLLAIPFTAMGIVRFFVSWKASDQYDIILCAVGFLMMAICAVTAQQQDFETATGAIQTYQGEYWWTYILYPFALIDLVLTILSTVITLGTVFKRRKQKFVPDYY